MRALLQATLLNTVQRELFRLKIEKKENSQNSPNAQHLFMTTLTIVLMV